MRDSVSGKGGCVMRDADYDGTSIREEIIDAVWYGDTGGIGAEIVIVDQARGQIPARPGILKGADQFALLGIDADDGQMTTLEAAAQFGQILELEVAIRTGIGGDLLVIDA